MNNLGNSIDWSLAYTEGSPLDAWTGFNPAITIMAMVRNQFFSPPFTWGWNRAENSAISTVAGTQDYTIPLTDFGFLEKVSLTDVNGNIFEIKDIYNSYSLSKTSTAVAARARPNAAAVISSLVGTSINLRFMSVPEAVYLINLTYQKNPINPGPYTLSSVGNVSGGNTPYTGVFDTTAFPSGAFATIKGFATPANNGTFAVVSATSSLLTVANAAGASETAKAYVINGSWAPIPDYYSDVYNNLFLAEALAATDDVRSQVYRQRGVAALVAKSEGLTEMQKSIYIQQMLNLNRDASAVTLKLQQSVQGRGQ